MHGSESVSHSMQDVFVFVLLGLFAVMSTLLVLLGALIYHGNVEKTVRNNESRVLSSYVRTMVRAEDAENGIRVEKNEDVDCLSLYEDIEGDIYVTWIYLYDGYLYEQFTKAGHEFSPEGGTAICPANSFVAEIRNRLLTVSMTNTNDEPCTVQVALRCVD